jgi:hypothetical protein
MRVAHDRLPALALPGMAAIFDPAAESEFIKKEPAHFHGDT